MDQRERELIRSLQQGEPDACRKMIEQYADKIYGVSLRLMKQPMEAEEVLQETFIDACNGVESFEGRSSLDTWLYRIATNNGLMRLRSQPEAHLPLDSSLELNPHGLPRQMANWPTQPEEIALDEELQAVMDTAIEELTPALRSAFVLRELQGLTTAEAAEVLGISQSALKVRLHRARLALREALSSYFVDDSGEQRSNGH